MLYRSDVKTASSVIGYRQTFGRIARGDRGKPVLIVQDFAGNGMAKVVRFGNFVPDCDDVMAEPVYDPVTNKPEDFGVLIPDTDDPNHPAWNGAVWNGRAFVFPGGRAACHSLNDGNRDSRWASLDRRAKKAINGYLKGVFYSVSDFLDEYCIPILWLTAVSALSVFTLIVVGHAQ